MAHTLAPIAVKLSSQSIKFYLEQMKKLGYGIKKFVENPFFLKLKPTLNNVQRGACIKALLPSDKMLDSPSSYLV